MPPQDDHADRESKPTTKTSRYLRTLNLVVRFTINIVKLVVMLASSLAN